MQCSVDSCCVYQLAEEAPAPLKPPKPTALAAEPCRYPAAPMDEPAAAAPGPPKLEAAALGPPKLAAAALYRPPAAGGPPKLGPDPPNADAAADGPPKDG